MICGIIIIIFLILYIDIDANNDYINIEKENKNINYKRKIIERAIVFSLLTISHYFLIDKNIIKNLLFFICMCFTYWFLFDLALNTLRNLKASYIGENSKIDLFLRKTKISHNYIFSIKKWLVVLSATLYFLSW